MSDNMIAWDLDADGILTLTMDDPDQGANTNYDAMLVFGKGWSYGAEFFLKRRLGKLTGWAGYTWSRTMRRFPDVNLGREFPSRWDRQ